ncbi:MAG: glycosyltransferase family 4 protein [Sphaerochaeta sp.]|nr:glycosyltransferase family 4 protein [Sphaerochaeta sp.]
MNILILSNLYPPHILGGYEILCAQVVAYLKDRGHQVHVLTSDHGGASSDAEVTRTLKVYQDFDKKAPFLRRARVRTARDNAKETKKILTQRKPDVVFVWSLLRLTPSCAHVAQRLGFPTVYTFNDENITSFSFHRFGFSPKQAVHCLLDLLSPHITLRGLDFTYTTCISQILKKNLLAKGLPIKESTVIYQGIPIEQFPLKDNSGIRTSPTKILYAGQLHHYKGVHTIFEALSILEKDAKLGPCSLTIVGKGTEEYTQKLKALASKLSLRVEFKGLVPHTMLPAIYRDMDIFIFPSIWEEPFGLTHLEAMASGLPVISTANGGQGEFLKDGENALTFSPDDPKDLALQLERLLSDDTLFKALSQKGRLIVEQAFTFDRYVDELEALVSRAVASSPR